MVDAASAASEAKVVEKETASSALSRRLALEYGVLHLKGALTVPEQKKLFAQVKAVSNLGKKAAKSQAHKDFFVSSGKVGASTRREEFHKLGNLLFQRIASRLAEVTTAGEMASELSLRRMQKVQSGEVPPHVNVVTGVMYQPGSRLNNHTDTKKDHLYTMSVALGGS